MTEGTAAGLVGVSGLVTFVSGNWYFGSFSEAGLTLVADEAIVEAAGSVGRSRGHRLRARRAGAGRWLSPVLPVTLRVDEGGLSLPGAGGARCPVGAPEARLLVHCVRAGALLSSTLGPNERGAAASLVTAGVLTYLDHAPLPSPSDGTVDSAPEPAGRPGRLLASRALDDPRIPVVGAYVAMLGPPLALGMLLAHGRVWNGGRLNEHFDLARPLTHDEARQFFDGYRGPAVLLCSNYLWSLDANLGLAAELKAANPELIVVHGGPSTPKYEQESAGFLARPEADILVLGEGEVTLAEVLGCLASSTWGDVTGLLQIPGVVVTDPETGLPRRTVPRDRIVDLDTLPSPYLTGEFDDLDPEAWNPANGGNVVLETNRGCPYKCTFCDWGSATLSRIRKFGIDRVFREIDWLGERGVGVWMLADANFGILPRDREIAGYVVQCHQRHGVPSHWSVLTAKNATRSIVDIISALCDEGISVLSTLSVQTRDAATLAAIDRSNIRPERYDELAVAYRRRRLPMSTDLLLGLPGSSVDSFKSDLQWCFDYEITPRTWLVQVLPNAPMNEPSYRARYAVETDEYGVVLATSTFSRSQREEMMSLRIVERAFEHLGLLRHVLRWLQWDHGHGAMDVMHELARLSREDPLRYPLLSWVQLHYDRVIVPPGSWGAMLHEVRQFVEEELGVRDTAGLDVVLSVQRALLPDRATPLPRRVSLSHDYVAYYADATEPLRSGSGPAGAIAPLVTYPAGLIEVLGDPGSVVEWFRLLDRGRVMPSHEPGELLNLAHLELDSALTRPLAVVRSARGYRAIAASDRSDEGVRASAEMNSE